MIGKPSVGKQHFGNELNDEAAGKDNWSAHYLSYEGH